MSLSNEAIAQIEALKKLHLKTADNYDSPPERMEKESGLSGISCDYKMPEGLSCKEYEIGFFNEFGMYKVAFNDMKTLKESKLKPENERNNDDLDVIDALGRPDVIEGYTHLASKCETSIPELKTKVDEIKKLNPELNKVRHKSDDFMQLFDFIQGVTSKFSPEDIEFYLNSTREERQASLKENEKLTAKYGVEIRWMPAKATQNKIANAAEEKQKRDSSNKSFDAYQEFLRSRGHYEY